MASEEARNRSRRPVLVQTYSTEYGSIDLYDHRQPATRTGSLEGQGVKPPMVSQGTQKVLDIDEPD